MIFGSVWAQTNTRVPYIGYLYPAGGQRGTEIDVTAGGQFLRNGKHVVVSGTGVKAEIVQFCPPLTNIGADERQEIQRRFREAFSDRIEERTGKPLPRPKDNPPAKPKTPDKGADDKTKSDPTPAPPERVKLPSHPALDNLDKKSLRELVHLRMTLFPDRNKLQMNRQISEGVLLKIAIAPDAEPGDRELRIQTATGLSNPILFQVGTFPEIAELEPNAGESFQAFPELSRIPKLTDFIQPRTLKLPVTLNGQILPGDIDRFRFSAEQGQQIVVEAQARGLIPYLADAVPGWFQATLTLYDSAGREMAFVDDYRFHPDPTMMVEIPRTGEYELEIRDAIYRGREDFVYRICIGRRPYITQSFPLGGRAGQSATAAIEGWNLSSKQLPLDTSAEGPRIRRARINDNGTPSNAVLYAVDDLPECIERETNDSIAEAQRVSMPVIINGRIDRDGDTDVYRVELAAGQEIVAEVYGRRLDSPIDSLVRLTDDRGNTLAINDDHVVKENYLYMDAQGLITHPADSRLQTKIPKQGIYYFHISDTQGHGSSAHSYRLRISSPRPGFELRLMPSSLSLRAGISTPVTVYALRLDGFGGAIDVRLRNSPGFRLDGGTIPAGVDRIRMTLTALADAPAGLSALELEGSARIEGKTIRRPVVPAEDRMQAFLYRHLVPSQELMASVDIPKWSPLIEPIGDPIRIPSGGQAQVVFATPRRQPSQNYQLDLLEPPAGITVDEITATARQLRFIVKADIGSVKIGYEDNLIVELFMERPQQKGGKPTGRTERVSVGVLPAIPIQVVEATKEVATEPAIQPVHMATRKSAKEPGK